MTEIERILKETLLVLQKEIQETQITQQYKIEKQEQIVQTLQDQIVILSNQCHDIQLTLNQFGETLLSLSNVYNNLNPLIQTLHSHFQKVSIK